MDAYDSMQQGMSFMLGEKLCFLSSAKVMLLQRNLYIIYAIYNFFEERNVIEIYLNLKFVILNTRDKMFR